MREFTDAIWDSAYPPSQQQQNETYGDSPTSSHVSSPSLNLPPIQQYDYGQEYQQSEQYEQQFQYYDTQEDG
jgi:hypothetical protein